MNLQKNNWLYLVLGVIIGALGMHFCSNYKIEKKKSEDISHLSESKSEYNYPKNENSEIKATSPDISIRLMSDEKTVINHVKTYHELPSYYITKSEARRQGWNPSIGNFCDVLPGRAIGGDKFSNREKTLPSGNQYFEADVNYNCGNRGADRIVFTKDGEVWLTKNHYKSFEKQ